MESLKDKRSGQGVCEKRFGITSLLSGRGEVQPDALALNYARLSRLRTTGHIQMSSSMRLDTSCLQRLHEVNPCVVMDVNYELKPKPSHDLGLELDMVRNDARYGPRLATTLLHRNPRGWGAENAWEFGFGYVAVSPFATLGSGVALNSAEWTLRWSTSQLGIRPLPLSKFRASTEPYTTFDLGWDREVWPEFTRSQLHVCTTWDSPRIPNAIRSFTFHPWRWRLSAFQTAQMPLSLGWLTI